MYCASVWRPGKRCFIDRLEAVQRRATRIMYKRSFSVQNVISYDERLRHFNIISIQDSLSLSRLVLGHKMFYNYCPNSFNMFLIRSRRVDGRLLHWTAKSNIFFNSVFVEFPRLWNLLPHHLQQIICPKKFRREVIAHFLNNSWTLIYLFHHVFLFAITCGLYGKWSTFLVSQVFGLFHFTRYFSIRDFYQMYNNNNNNNVVYVYQTKIKLIVQSAHHGGQQV